MTLLCLCCCIDFSLVVAHGFLLVVASLVAEHGLSGTWATGLFDHIDSSNHPISSQSDFLETCPNHLLNSCLHILPLTHSSTLKLDCHLYHLEATILCPLPLSRVWLWIPPSVECSVPLVVWYHTSCCLLVSFEDTTFLCPSLEGSCFMGLGPNPLSLSLYALLMGDHIHSRSSVYLLSIYLPTYLSVASNPHQPRTHSFVPDP